MPRQPDIGCIIADLVRSGTAPDLVGRVAAGFVALAGAAAAAQQGTAALQELRSKGAERTARWRARKRFELAAGAEEARRLAGSGGDGRPLDTVTSPAKVRDGGDVVVTLRDHVRKRAELPAIPEIVEASGSTPARYEPPGKQPPPGHVTSRGDGVTQKEVPPHPLKKNTTPQTPRLRRQRHAVTAEAVRHGATIRVKVTSDTPLFRECVVLYRAGHGGKEPPDRGHWHFDPELVAEAERRLQVAVVALPIGDRGRQEAGEEGKPASREGKG